MRDTIDTLERAINVLQRKMRSSAMLQAKLDTADVNKLVKVMSTMIDAAALSLHDKQKLLGLVQNSEQQQEQDDDMETDLGAPAAKAYETSNNNSTKNSNTSNHDDSNTSNNINDNSNNNEGLRDAQREHRRRPGGPEAEGRDTATRQETEQTNEIKPS